MHTFGGVGQMRKVYLTVSVSSASALLSTQHTPALCSTHCSSGNVILPNPRTLDEYTPHQYWSANFIV